MRDANFLDPRLAPLYDTVNASRADTEFYVRQAGGPSLAIVDIGCGTGVLALRLAAEGHRVTGVDPAGPMLAVARAADAEAERIGRSGGLLVRNSDAAHQLDSEVSRQHSIATRAEVTDPRTFADQRVEWIEGDVGSLPPGPRFDLAVMTGHVFQVFLDDAEVTRVLGGIRSHLRPGGRLMFETRNPAVRAWETWVPGTSLRTAIGDDGSTITTEHKLLDVTGELVSFETTHDLAATGERIRSRSTLRFMGPETLLGHLADAGFETVTLLGDWDGAPFTDASPEIIVVAL